MPRIDGIGRTVATEVLIGNRTVREFIQQHRPFKEIVMLIEDGASQYGMQTFDQSIYSLWKSKIISKDTALQFATSPKDLQLRMQGLFS